MPDPGDYMRALAGEDEVIISLPAARMEEFMAGIPRVIEGEYGYERASMYMLPDFPQPPFYQMLFERWRAGGEGKKRRNRRGKPGARQEKVTAFLA